LLFAEVVAVPAELLCVAVVAVVPAVVAAAAAHAGDGAAGAKLHDLAAGLQSINSLVATLRKLHPAESRFSQGRLRVDAVEKGVEERSEQ
jgi:hypothetical protein